MKKNIILGCVWIVVALILIWCLVSLMKNGISFGKIFSKSESNIISENVSDENTYKIKSIEASDIEKIKTDLLSESLKILATSDNNIKVALYGNGWTEKNEANISVTGNQLKIKTQKKFNKIGSRGVAIFIPSKMLDSKTIEIECNTASGSISVMENINLKNLTVNTASGSIHIDKADNDKTEINTASGSVHSDANVKFLEINGVSSSVHINGSIEQFKIATVSGSVKINNDIPFTKKSEVETVSGSVSIDLPAESEFEVSYETLSGSIKNEFTNSKIKKSGTEIVGNGNAKLEVETLSGSIKINKKSDSI